MSEHYTHMNDDLLVKHLLGETSGEEAQRVEAWLATDEANRRYYGQLRSVWLESKKLSASLDVNEHAAWNRFRNRIGNGEQADAIPLQTKKRNGWLRVAALFILVAGLAALILTINSESNVEQVAVQSQGDVLVDTLPDGSVITLNKNSALTYPEKFRGNRRAVSLEGEAFFNITPDKEKPFEITVNDVLVKVVGTSFNIRSENGETEVIVETGVVQVIRKGRMVELRPKEKLVVHQQDTSMMKQKEEEKLYQHYRSREFVCDGTPLWKLVEVLNEAYGVNIVIERNELRSLPLDVTFSNESLDVILDIIRQTFNTHQIEIVRTGDKIILR